MASLNIDISHISPFNIDRSFQSPLERSPYISPKVLAFRTERDKQNQGLMTHHQAGVGIDDLPPAIAFTAPQMLGSNKQRISPTNEYIKSALIVTKNDGCFFYCKKKKRSNPK